MTYREELLGKENENYFFSRVRKAWERIERAMQVATKQLKHRARPWIWGLLPKDDANGVVSFGIAFEEQSTKERPYASV